MSISGNMSIGSRRKLNRPSTTSAIIIMVVKTGRLIATPLSPPPRSSSRRASRPPSVSGVFSAIGSALLRYRGRRGRRAARDPDRRPFLDAAGCRDHALARVEPGEDLDHAAARVLRAERDGLAHGPAVADRPDVRLGCVAPYRTGRNGDAFLPLARQDAAGREQPADQ